MAKLTQEERRTLRLLAATGDVEAATRLLANVQEPEIGTCQGCGSYLDAMRYTACPHCGGYVG